MFAMNRFSKLCFKRKLIHNSRNSNQKEAKGLRKDMNRNQKEFKRKSIGLKIGTYMISEFKT